MFSDGLCGNSSTPVNGAHALIQLSIGFSEDGQTLVHHLFGEPAYVNVSKFVYWSQEWPLILPKVIQNWQALLPPSLHSLELGSSSTCTYSGGWNILFSSPFPSIVHSFVGVHDSLRLVVDVFVYLYEVSHTNQNECSGAQIRINWAGLNCSFCLRRRLLCVLHAIAIGKGIRRPW